MGGPERRRFPDDLPYLKKLGVSDKQLIYKFDYDGVRFIFLWTGPYKEKDPTGWLATRPAYQEQMNQLRQWLDEAKAAGTKKYLSRSTTRFSPVQEWAACQRLRIPTNSSRNTQKTST